VFFLLVVRQSRFFQQIGTNVADPSGVRLHRASKLPRYIPLLVVTEIVVDVAERPPSSIMR